MFNPYDIVYSVMITEKATAASETLHKYTFKVNPKANKIEIAKAVMALFEDVKVASVNVMNYEGKLKRAGRGTPGRRADWKRAVVTLAEGSIEII